MNYLTARIDKLEKEYNLLEKDNNRLAARNQNYLEMLEIAKNKYGDGAFVDPDAELRREVFQKGCQLLSRRLTLFTQISTLLRRNLAFK